MRSENASNLAAPSVLFIGVGPLHSFRYAEIRKFGKDVISALHQLSQEPVTAALTIQGVNYGLDEQEAVFALLAGLMDGAQSVGSVKLKLLTIVESGPQRYNRLLSYWQSFTASVPYAASKQAESRMMRRKTARRPVTDAALERNKTRPSDYEVGSVSESKPHIFTAMPFADEYLDEWEIGIREPTTAAGFLCERLDVEIFTGDILVRIKERIESCAALVGILTGDNPNVYLEIGYAWGKGKPTILAVKEGQKVKFDLQGQKYMIYKNITDLRSKMRREIEGLKNNGII